jgi:hypothetical protein
MHWLADYEVYEYEDGVCALDVAYDRPDVNKRIAKGRILDLIRCGLATVCMDVPGVRRVLVLTDEGRRVNRLWHRAERNGLVTEAPRDVKHPAKNPERVKPYPWLSEGKLFEAERRALAEQGDDVAAEESAPVVEWSPMVVKIMEAATGHELWIVRAGGYTTGGRKVSTERVHELMEAGWLYESGDGRVYAKEEGKRALAEHQNQDQGAPEAAPVPVPVVPVRLALEAAPVRLALTAAPAPVSVEAERQGAAEVVAGLRWCRAFADVVRAARDGALYPEEGGKFRLMGAVGSKGRPVKAERVRLFMGAGFLALESSGLVVPTADGLEALRLVDLAPEALMPEADVMAHVRKARRARQWDTKAGQDAHALPVLPGGGEEGRRRAAARKAAERWEQEAEQSRKRTEAVMAKARIRDRRERQAEERKRAAELEPCRDCRGMYPVEVRCGKCRERAAMGLPLVDFLALPPAPVRAAADVVSDPGTVDGWEGDGGACPEVAAPQVDEAWPYPRSGTVAPVRPALPVSRGVTSRASGESGERVTLAGHAGRTTYARVVGGSDSLDVFATLDAELQALAADWDSVTA